MKVEFKNIIVVLLSVLFTIGQATLRMYMPNCAVKIASNLIPYTLSNFGEIPYGATVLGELSIPKNNLLCESKDEVPLTKDSLKNFMLIQRGDCKFTKKIIQAQNLKADLAIIYDNQTSQFPRIVMANDGHGHLVEIPSIFIRRQDGLLLKQALEKCQNTAILMLKFDVFKSDRLKVVFWLDVGQRQTFIMLRDFYEQYYNAINPLIDLEVKFKTTLDCPSCKKDDCVQQERLCYTVPQSYLSQNNGQQFIKEHLRVYYLWEYVKGKDQALWWKYMIKFDDEDCIEDKKIYECSENVMKRLLIDYKIINNTAEESYKKSVNKQIANQLEQISVDGLESDILFYPEVTINLKNFYGLFKAHEIFQMLCSSLNSPPDECVSFLRDQGVISNPQATSNIYLTVAGILFVMTMGFLLCLFVYARLIKRQVNQQMSVEVNKMVEHYVTLTQQKSQPSINKSSTQQM